jgi:hypothetical protein
MPGSPVPYDKRLSITPDTLINVIDGESVILNMKSESYYGLDQIGTRMWTLLTTSDSIQTAYQQLLTEYDVSADVLRKDLNDFIDKLMTKGLLKINDE